MRDGKVARVKAAHRLPRVAVAAVAVAAVAVAAVAVGAALFTRRDGLADAVRVLSDESAFDTTTRAAQSFARVSDMLRSEGTRCAGSRSAEARRCAGTMSAAAWAQVTAFTVQRCTQTHIARARLSLRRHLLTVDRPGGDRVSDLPPLVRC